MAAGIAQEVANEVRGLIRDDVLTWEERVVAFADACTRGAKRVTPSERFADLRERYETHALIALQEEATAEIGAALRKALGRDPLSVLGLAAP